MLQQVPLNTRSSVGLFDIKVPNDSSVRSTIGFRLMRINCNEPNKSVSIIKNPKARRRRLCIVPRNVAEVCIAQDLLG